MLSIDFALPACRVREVLLECDASSHRFIAALLAKVDEITQRDLLPNEN